MDFSKWSDLEADFLKSFNQYSGEYLPLHMPTQFSFTLIRKDLLLIYVLTLVRNLRIFLVSLLCILEYYVFSKSFFRGRPSISLQIDYDNPSVCAAPSSDDNIISES